MNVIRFFEMLTFGTSSNRAVLGGGVSAASSKDKKTWKVKVAKQFKKMGGSGQQQAAEKGDKSQAQAYPEGGSIGVPGSEPSNSMHKSQVPGLPDGKI